MGYKAVNRSSQYLIHYNKNHSKANGQFTSGDGDGDGIVDDHHNQNKFLNKDGSLSDYGKKSARLNSIDMTSKRNVGYKKAQKLINKDLRKINSWGLGGEYALESDAIEYFTEKKLEADIARADKDKSFMADLRAGVQKYFDLESKDWNKAYEYEQTLREDLQKKYPQHKDVLNGMTIGENVWSGNYKQWMKKDNAFSDILNNDFYYEESDLDSASVKEVEKIVSAYNLELAKTMIQKYGSYNVDSNWKKELGLD